MHCVFMCALVYNMMCVGNVFQLEDESQVWWDWVKTSRDLETMTWVEFLELFMGKYFPSTARYAKAQEFLELK